MAGCSEVDVSLGPFDSGFGSDAGTGKDAAVSSNGDDAGNDEDSGSAPVTDAGTSATGDAGATITTESASSFFASAVCSAYRDCMGDALLVDFLSGSDCVTFLQKQQADREVQWLADSIAAGRVVYQPDSLADCATALKAFKCEVASRRLPERCEQAFHGTVALGGACSIDYDCEGNEYCAKGATDQSCPGKCTALNADGSSCNASNECFDGYICRAGKCATPLNEGDSCEAAACPAGLVCQGTTGSRTCQSNDSVYVGEVGDDCDAVVTLCKPGLVCASASSANTMGKCVAKSTSGGACKRGKPNPCPADEYCDAANPGDTGKCVGLPIDGEACVRKTCAPDYVCYATDDDPNGTCYAYAAIGSACVLSGQCYSGICDSGKCIAPLECL